MIRFRPLLIACLIFACAALPRLLIVAQPIPTQLDKTLPDDAYYYFLTARNAAEGRGASVDGINPSNGWHPLWMLANVPIFAPTYADSGHPGSHRARARRHQRQPRRGLHLLGAAPPAIRKRRHRRRLSLCHQRHAHVPIGQRAGNRTRRLDAGVGVVADAPLAARAQPTDGAGLGCDLRSRRSSPAPIRHWCSPVSAFTRRGGCVSRRS